MQVTSAAAQTSVFGWEKFKEQYTQSVAYSYVCAILQLKFVSSFYHGKSQMYTKVKKKL